MTTQIKDHIKLTFSLLPRRLALRGSHRLTSKGFTVLEAMIALVILSIALLALLRVMPVGIKGSKLAEETTIATILAQKKIEEARAATWPPSSVTKINLGSEGYSNFDYIRDVTSVSPTTYLREVTVSIYWPAGTEQRVVGVTTYVANYSP